MIYEESGMRVDLTNVNGAFRFQDLKAYNRIKGQSVTEMDVCWIEREGKVRPVLYLVELKQFFDAKNEKFRPVDLLEEWENYLTRFSKNLWHSLAMLAHNRCGTQTEIQGLLPFDFEEVEVKAMFVLMTQPLVDLQPFQIALQKRLADASAIFRLSSLAVLSHEDAVALLPNIFRLT